MAARTRIVKYGTGREEILKAAVHVAARKGLRGLTYRAVADEASVNNSLVAHHFGSRDALIEAALEWATDRSIEASGLDSFAASEETYVTELMGMLFSDPDLQVFQYEMILESRRRPELVDSVQRLYENYVQALETSFRSLDLLPADPALVRVIFAALDGLVLQYISGVDRSLIEASVQSLWRVLVDARSDQLRAGSI